MVVESAKSLATCITPAHFSQVLEAGDATAAKVLLGGTYLSYPPDVLFPVLWREAEVLVQAEADVVAVQSVARQALLEEMLLEGDGDCGLSRGGEAGEPDGAALLLAELTALLAGEACVPCDVAGFMSGFVHGRVLPLEVGWWGHASSRLMTLEALTSTLWRVCDSKESEVVDVEMSGVCGVFAKNSVKSRDGRASSPQVSTNLKLNRGETTQAPWRPLPGWRAPVPAPGSRPGGPLHVVARSRSNRSGLHSSF